MCQSGPSYLMANLCPSVSPEFPYCALEETLCQSGDHPAEKRREGKNKRKSRTGVKNRTEHRQQKKH